MSDIADKVGIPNASDYQIAIFEDVEKQVLATVNDMPPENSLIQATAGSGKTTTIVAAAKLVPRRTSAAFFAFNTDIARELSTRLPRHVDARTLNSLGARIWTRFYRGTFGAEPVLDNRKTFDIIRGVIPNYRTRLDYSDDLRFLVSMCKAKGVTTENTPNVVPVEGRYATNEMLLNICRDNNRFVPPDKRATLFQYAREVLAESLRRTDIIDFDDQKYLPVVYRPSGEPINAMKHDYIFVDEAQDLNEVDIELLAMCMHENTFICGVCDENQAIYAFRGSASDSLSRFRERFNAKTMPLSISYRCAKAIVEEARKIHTGIEAYEHAPEGEVIRLGKFRADYFQAGDMVLCRNNAPLVGMAFKLISNRIPVIVKGRDIGSGLLRAVSSIGGATVSEFNTKLEEWRDTQLRILHEDEYKDESEIDRVMDRYSTLKIFINNVNDNSIETLLEDIKKMFSDNDLSNKVVFSSVHKSKGLEADRVILMNEELFSPPWLKEGSVQEGQERNLKFVAVTRAKNTFVYMDTNNMITS